MPVKNDSDRGRTGKTDWTESDRKLEFSRPVIYLTNKDPDSECWLIDSGSTIQVINSHVGMTN